MKTPRFTHGFVDRHGKARFYFRRADFKQTPLPGLPWSPEFMATYEAAMKGETVPRVDIGARRTKPGTIAALTIAYFNSHGFRSLAPSTQSTYRGIIDRFSDEHGDKRIALLGRDHILKIVAKKIETPSAANNFLKMIRMLMAFAVAEGMRADDPTLGIKGIKNRSTGFHTWDEEEIAAFERTHPVGTRARLALALLLFTAQRRSDVVRMGRQHIRDEVLSVTQQKTAMELEIPVHSELRAVIDATPSDHLTFLTTQRGEPFSPAGFTNWFRDCCNEAALAKGCSPHGLRKAACRRLAEAGCSANLIMSISGHKTLKEVARYTDAADRKWMAVSAMQKIETKTSSGKPGKRVANRVKKA